MTKQPQIVGLGGGGFAMEPDNPLLDRYALAQSSSDNPVVCLLATASGDSDGFIGRFHVAFARYPCRPRHLAVFGPKVSDWHSYLLESDVIYVGGGNTRAMLAVWREFGLDNILRQAWQQGIVLTGLSAGLICWFQQGHTDSMPGKLDAMDCLGFLPGSASPHFNGEAKRRPSFHALIESGRLAAGYGVDDGAALHFIGTELHAVVSSRADAHAYRVCYRDGALHEEKLATRFLGA